jgi:hypothetical protein
VHAAAVAPERGERGHRGREQERHQAAGEAAGQRRAGADADRGHDQRRGQPSLRDERAPGPPGLDGEERDQEAGRGHERRALRDRRARVREQDPHDEDDRRDQPRP